MIEQMLQNNNILIIYGKTGTGKTYRIKKFARDNNYQLINISDINVNEFKRSGMSTSLYKNPLYYIDIDNKNKKLLDYLTTFKKKIIIEIRDNTLIPRGYPVIYQPEPKTIDKVHAFIEYAKRPPNYEETKELEKIDNLWEIKNIVYGFIEKDNKIIHKKNIPPIKQAYYESLSRKAPISKYLNEIM